MTRDRVRMGIVGTGRIAQNRHLPSYQKNDRVVVVAAADPVPEAVHSAAATFGIPSVYTDYREMLEREDLDAVSVCTPNKYHAPVATAALRQGLHVFCEKPLARTATEARAMVRLARETGRILATGYRYRHQAEARAAKRVIDAGELGDIYMMRARALRRRKIPSWGTFTDKEIQGGGALVDFGVHVLDLALWLAGHPRVLEVTGVTSQRLGTRPGVNEWGPWEHTAFEVEDHAAAFLRFEGGRALQLEVSWALNIAQSEESVSLSGTAGGLDVYPFQLNKAVYGMLVNCSPAWMPGQTESEWDLQVADFVEAILENREPLVKPEQALQVNEIVDAIYESAATGAAVALA